MDFEFIDDGTVQINMKDYLIEAIEDFGEKIRPRASTPAALNLTSIDYRSPALPQKRKRSFIVSL